MQKIEKLLKYQMDAKDMRRYINYEEQLYDNKDDELCK
jgi:hypothetical protein